VPLRCRRETLQQGRVHDVKGVVVKHNSARAVHAGENVELVGHAIPLGVATAHHPAVIAVPVDRAILIDPHKNLAGGRGGDAGGITERPAAPQNKCRQIRPAL